MRILLFLLVIFCWNTGSIQAQKNSRQTQQAQMYRNPLDTLMHYNSQFVKREVIYIGAVSQIKVEVLIISFPLLPETKPDKYIRLSRVDDWDRRLRFYTLIYEEEVTSLLESIEFMNNSESSMNNNLRGYSEYYFHGKAGCKIGCYSNIQRNRTYQSKNNKWSYFVSFNDYGSFGHYSLSKSGLKRWPEILKQASLIMYGG